MHIGKMPGVLKQLLLDRRNDLETVDLGAGYDAQRLDSPLAAVGANVPDNRLAAVQPSAERADREGLSIQLELIETLVVEGMQVFFRRGASPAKRRRPAIFADELPSLTQQGIPPL